MPADPQLYLKFDGEDQAKATASFTSDPLILMIPKNEEFSVEIRSRTRKALRYEEVSFLRIRRSGDHSRTVTLGWADLLAARDGDQP